MPLDKSVLLVDDNPVLVDSFARMLRNHWNVVRAYSVPQAIGKIAEKAPDVVLTDWDMPDGGGEAVAKEARHRGIPVVVISGGFAFRRALEKAVELSNKILDKPPTLSEIDKALWDALACCQKSPMLGEKG